MAGLKSDTRDWVLIHDPSSWGPALSTKQHIKKRGTIIHTILVARLKLLCSRLLVAKCQLAAASSHGAVTRLPVVSSTNKHTASSLDSGSSHSRCSNDHRARIRARITKGL